MSAANAEVEPLAGPNTLASSGPGDEELSEDQIFHLLQSRRRRLALRYMNGADGRERMRDVAEQVAAWEHGTTVQALSSDQRQRVYIPLYQSHLPKLDEAGVIRYDQSRGVVERTDLADQLDPYLGSFGPTLTGDGEDDDERGGLRGLIDGDRRWPLYYLGVSGIASTLLAGSTLGVEPLATLADGTLTVVVLAMYWLVVAAHLLDERVVGASESADQ